MIPNSIFRVLIDPIPKVTFYLNWHARWLQLCEIKLGLVETPCFLIEQGMASFYNSWLQKDATTLLIFPILVWPLYVCSEVPLPFNKVWISRGIRCHYIFLGVGGGTIERVNIFNVHFISQLKRQNEREGMKSSIFIFVGRVIFLGDCDHTH